MFKKLVACLSLLMLVAALLLFAPTLAQTDPPAVNLGSVRLINALVGLGPVDVYLDQQPVAFGLPVETATAYIAVPVGKHTLAVRPADADPLSGPITDVLVDVSANHSVSVIAYQKQFATEADTASEVPAFQPPVEQSGAMFVIADDRSPIELGRTRLTAVHLAPGTPQRVSVTYPSRASLLHQVGLEQPFGTIDINAGIYSLRIVDADSQNLNILSFVPDQSFHANTLYTLIVVPDLRPAGFEVGPVALQPRLIAIPAPIDPPAAGVKLRIVHAAHSTAVLDIYIDERLVAAGVNYGEVTEYLGLEDYSHTLTLRPFRAPASSPPLARAEFAITDANRIQPTWTLLLLNAGEDTDTTSALQVIQPGAETGPEATPRPPQIINTPGGSLVMTLLPDNVSIVRGDRVRIRLINAVESVPRLALWTPALPLPRQTTTATPTPTPTPRPEVGPPPPSQLIDPVLFGAEANELEVPAGLYTVLNVIPEGSNNPLIALQNQRLVQGMVYTFVVVGSPVGNPPVRVVALTDYGTGQPVERLYVGVVSVSTVNVRSQPNPNAGIRIVLRLDNQMEVLGRSEAGDWIRIRYTSPRFEQPIDGWISANINAVDVTRLGVPINVQALPIFREE